MGNNKTFYEELLKNQEANYELMCDGVVSNAKETFQRALLTDPLTLEEVCHVTDKLDHMLSILKRNKDDIDFTKRKVAVFQKGDVAE